MFSIGCGHSCNDGRRWVKTDTVTKTSTDIIERKYLAGNIGNKNNTRAVTIFNMLKRECDAWCVRGKMSRIDGPAMMSYKNDSLDLRAWYLGGVSQCVPIFLQTV